MSELIIHLGVPKTGTTAIQGYLYRNRQRLADAGVFYPETFLDNFSEQERWAHHLHAHKWDGWLDKSQFMTSPDEAWQHLAKTIAKQPGRYLLSSERFADLFPSESGKKTLEFICNATTSKKICFIGYIRRQDILAESFLKQSIKVDLQKESTEHYLSNLPPFLDFDHLFSTLAEFVGWENVIVRTYERGKLKAQDAVIDFLDALGLEGFPDDGCSTSSANESINTLTASLFLKLTERGIINNTINIKKALRTYLEHPQFAKFDQITLFDTKIRRQILDRYTEGNKRLAAKLTQPHSIDDILQPVEDFSASISENQALFSIEQICEIIELVYKNKI